MKEERAYPGTDFPAEHHMKIKGQSVVARFAQDHVTLGCCSSWEVLRKRRGGREEYLGGIPIPSDLLHNTKEIRVRVADEIFGIEPKYF